MSKTLDKIIPRIAISIGDTNGIGLEVIMKTFSDARMLDLCTPIIFGSSKILSFHRKELALQNFQYQTIKSAEEAIPGKVNLVNSVDKEIEVELGVPTPSGGAAAFQSLDAACKAIEDKHADALVTAPINKDTIQSEDFNFPGHTEYLSQRFEGEALMLMYSESVTVGTLTGHIPLDKVASNLDYDGLKKKINSLSQTLQQDMRKPKPRIAVLGLNPHAGENGLLGKEDKEIIKPAIDELYNGGKMVFGPYSADGFFGSGIYAKFDAVMAMYHDQGLIPFKTLSFNSGVNFTSGLSVIRTSPDHGTGFDIAGKNEANPQSFREAVYFACNVFTCRNEYSELTADVLQIKKQDKRR